MMNDKFLRLLVSYDIFSVKKIRDKYYAKYYGGGERGWKMKIQGKNEEERMGKEKL